MSRISSSSGSSPIWTLAMATRMSGIMNIKSILTNLTDLSILLWTLIIRLMEYQDICREVSESASIRISAKDSIIRLIDKGSNICCVLIPSFWRTRCFWGTHIVQKVIDSLLSYW